MKKISDQKLITLTEVTTTLPELAKIAEAEYNYQTDLTKQLDNHGGPLTYTNLLEIMLWKINRYPTINEQILTELNELKTDYSIEKARTVLGLLLDCKGIDLPVASTILRFTDPDHFQILDQRVYRFINGSKELKLPTTKEKKVDLYFAYLQKLREIQIEYGIPFQKADRILYQIDKSQNKEIPIKY